MDDQTIQIRKKAILLHIEHLLIHFSYKNFYLSNILNVTCAEVFYIVVLLLLLLLKYFSHILFTI